MASPNSETELSTNGLLLKEKVSARLLEMNVTDINISLFGSDQETQAKMMGEQINYRKVHDNILNLLKLKKVIGSKTNINLVKIVDSPYLDNSEINFDYWIDKDVNVFNYGYLNRSENTGALTQREVSKIPNGCELNRHNERIYIDVRGNITFCCHDWRNVHIIGNIMDDDLEAIFNSLHYNAIRDMVDGKKDSDINFLCRKCKLCP